MSTIGVIATTVVIALFVFALLASAGVLIWVSLKARKELQKAVSDFHNFAIELNDALDTHREHMLKGLESASTSHQLLSEEIRSTLNNHRELLNAQIVRIRGEELEAASKVAVQAARRIEVAAAAFGELARALLNKEGTDLDESVAERAGLPPDAYAPNPTGERWTGVGAVSAADEQVLADEALDVQSNFPG